MLTEFEVRSRVAAIRQSEASPLRKVRQLLRVGRQLDEQARTLQMQTHLVASTPDRNASATLHRMTRQAIHLRRDIRDQAWTLLQG